MQTVGPWSLPASGFFLPSVLLDQLTFSHPVAHSKTQNNYKKQRPGSPKDQGPVGKRQGSVCAWEAHFEGGGEVGGVAGEFP